MDIEIRPLSPELAGDYFDLFENVAFADHAEWAGCYCLFYHIGPSRERELDQLTLAERKFRAEEMIQCGALRGYLA